jgi:hypothetical protein
MTSKPQSLVAPAIGHSTRTIEEFILILAGEINLQKFSSLCQAQYRKPTGGFLAAFTQSGSNASVSGSMVSSCGRYQMTAAMLTNKHALRSSISGVSERHSRPPALKYPSTPGSKTRDRSNVTQPQVSLNGACVFLQTREVRRDALLTLLT